MVQAISHRADFCNLPSDRSAGTMPVCNNLNLNAASNSADKATPVSEDSAFISFIKGVVDIINPLQHIPVVGDIYRSVTGDEISPAAKVAGDVLYGGAVGGVTSLANLAYENAVGSSVSESILASFVGEEDASPIALVNNATDDANQIIWRDDHNRASAMALQMSNAVEKYNEIINRSDVPELSILS